MKCGIFPLLKNKPELVAKAREVQALLRPQMNVFYDEAGASAGAIVVRTKRARPFGITIDFETLGERDPALRDTVTLRHRDSMEQERIAIADLPERLPPANPLSGYLMFYPRSTRPRILGYSGVVSSDHSSNPTLRRATRRRPELHGHVDEIGRECAFESLHRNVCIHVARSAAMIARGV